MTWKAHFKRQVPTGNKTTVVDVVSLAPHGSALPVSGLAYLQYVRSGILKLRSTTGKAEASSFSINYQANIAKYAHCLSSALGQALGGEGVDAILKVQSSKDLNKPYIQAILIRYLNTAIVIDYLKRLGSDRSGEVRSVAAVLGEAIEMNLLSLDNIFKLVIADDVLSSRKAAGATITRLQAS